MIHNNNGSLSSSDTGKPNKLKGVLFVFISAVLYGSYGVWAVLLGKDFGVFYQGWVRALLVLLILVPICVYNKKWTSMKMSDIKHFLWPLGFLLFSQAPIYYAFQNAGVGITSLIFFGSYVVASYIVGAVLLKEEMTKVKVASLLIALIGLYVTFSGSLGAFSFLALSMAVVGGISGGGGMSATKLIPKHFSTLQILVITWSQSLILHLPISLLLGESQLIPTVDIRWFALVGFALAGVLSSWFLVEGLKHIDASVGGLVSLLEIVVAIVFGYVIFSESVYISTILGALLIVTATALPNIIKVVNRERSYE